MQIRINKWIILALFLAICGAMYLLGVSRYHQRAIGAENAINQYRDTIRQYSVVIAGQTKEVTELKQLVVTKEVAISEGLIEKDKWKKLYYREIENNTQLSAQVSLLIDSIHAIKPQIIYITTEKEDTVPCVVLPYDWHYHDKWVSASGHVNRAAETSLRLNMPLEFDVVLGTKRGGIPSVSILENNPYITVTGIKSIKVENKKWYDNHWVSFGAGVLAASGIVWLVK